MDTTKNPEILTIEQLLVDIGDNYSRPGTVDTPSRVVKANKEIYRGYNPIDFKLTKFQTKYEGIIIRKEIPFTSYCEHHMLPFTGTIDFGYIPDGEILGLSKIIRLFQHLTSRLWTQEDMTDCLIDAFEKVVHPKGSIIIVNAVHTCEGNRGVRVPGVNTGTCTVRGIFKTDRYLEEKFYTLIG